MSDCFFRKRIPIEIEVVMKRDTIAKTATSILNKMAEARFDGQNTQYVNNMQPETDFCQDNDLVKMYFEEGIANIIRRIEPYVKDCKDGIMGYKIFSLVFPENWKANQQPVLERKMESYLVSYIVAQWLEKVSVSDTAYTMEKAAQLLRDIKGVCELRKGNVHRGWNTTY